jgi:hypothetical protein
MTLNPFSFVMLIVLIGAAVGVGVIYFRRTIRGEPSQPRSEIRASDAGLR